LKCRPTRKQANASDGAVSELVIRLPDAKIGDINCFRVLGTRRDELSGGPEDHVVTLWIDSSRHLLISAEDAMTFVSETGAREFSIFLQMDMIPVLNGTVTDLELAFNKPEH
jgi:hypothetical protein